MDLRQIECFLCLYRNGGMTRAAAELGIVQSALSTQLAKLEKTLKVQLFERSSRGVTPTAAGVDLYKMLLPLSKEVESVRQRMLDLSGGTSGLIRVGTVPSLGASIVPRALSLYTAENKDVTIRLTEAYSAGLVERLDAGELDVAIVNLIQPVRSLETTPLVSEELVLVTASDSALRNVEFGELPIDALIVPSLGQGLRAIIDPVLKKRSPGARPRLEMDALTPTLELVKSGAWATILPISAIAHELDAGALSVRRIHADMQRQLVVVNHPRRPLSLAAQRFVAALASEAHDAVSRAQRFMKSLKIRK
ncbi:LysR family transcriptional regulator [Achromobacter sp. NPDC058515]|uniref:LysR family transcriptional regulator n=1 Tax=Achromobacter sp. NPDC058515 TaxID=3346533 RepID=UPI00365A1C99